MAAYGLGRAPYPGVGGYSGECVLFVRLGGTRSLFTRLRLKMREEKKSAKNKINSSTNTHGTLKSPVLFNARARSETKLVMTLATFISIPSHAGAKVW